MVEGSQQKALGRLLVLACCQLSQAWGRQGGKDEAQRKLPVDRRTWDRNAGKGEGASSASISSFLREPGTQGARAAAVTTAKGTRAIQLTG